MVAISFDKTVKNYIYNKIIKNPGKFFSQILKGNLSLEKANFDELLDLFLKYRPMGPVPQLIARQMMCAFKERAAKISSTITPKLGGYAALKKSVETLIGEILSTSNFKRGWVVAKFSTPSVNKQDTINKIDIHLIGYVQKQDDTYAEVGTPISCGSKNGYDSSKNRNFTDALKEYSERGGLAHEVFNGGRAAAKDSFQELILHYTKGNVYIYLGLDLNGGYTSVIFSNEENLEKLAENCNGDMAAIANLVSFDEGGTCCPPY